MFVQAFLFLYICELCLGGDALSTIKPAISEKLHPVNERVVCLMHNSPYEPYYTAEWSDIIKSCPDFENTHFNCDNVELGSSAASDDADAGLSISGKLVFLEDMQEGISVDLQISKCTELGDEPMYNVKSDFCSSLSNSDAPWHPLVITFNSTKCPIPKNEYPLDGLEISIDFAEDVMSHEFVGEYIAQVAMMDNMDMVSCHLLSMAVVEKYDDDK